MNITLTIPDDQANQLQQLAQYQNRSLDSLLTEFLLETIRQKLAHDQQLQQLVTETRALPYNPNNLRLAQGSLKDSPVDDQASTFDLETWNQQWMIVEAQMKRIDQANDSAEGLL